jgi:Cu/Ag efflux pump CusA
VQTVAKTIPGLRIAKLDQQSSIPQLRIEANRDRATAYGVTPGSAQRTAQCCSAAKRVAELREGQRAVNLVIRLPWSGAIRRTKSPPAHRNEKRPAHPAFPGRGRARGKGPNVIFRENSQRRFTLAIKPTVRDVGRSWRGCRRKCAKKVKLPEGYFITYEGEFQAQKEATQRIVFFSAVVFVVIVFLLYGYFQSLALALQVMLSIPLSLVGGLVYTWLKLDNISIATLVGFIAVGGVAARNGIMMLSHYLHLMKHEGEGFTRQMVERGTLERMVPVLMTALAAGIALIPLVLAGDQPGKEILHPVAVVIVGGLVSSTLLEFLVRPASRQHFKTRANFSSARAGVYHGRGVRRFGCRFADRLRRRGSYEAKHDCHDARWSCWRATWHELGRDLVLVADASLPRRQKL